MHTFVCRSFIYDQIAMSCRKREHRRWEKDFGWEEIANFKYCELLRQEKCKLQCSWNPETSRRILFSTSVQLWSINLRRRRDLIRRKEIVQLRIVML